MLDIRSAPAAKAGGQGDRYTIRLGGQTTFLFFEHNTDYGSSVLGFVFNNADVANEMAALANVAAQYALALDAGAVDPETVLPEFLAALDAAGMQTYLDAANAQLEAYLAK